MKIRLILALVLMICFLLNAEVLTIESESVTFDSKLPEVSIYNPAGGEVYSPDEIVDVDFSIVEDSFADQSESAVVLQFYFDEVHDPEYDVALSADSLYNYDWTAAEVISEDVIVKIIATDYYGNPGEAESGSFMIINLEADFEADITSGLAPFEVNFTDLSTGNISNWEWDFENDGVIDSYEQNPGWVYEEPGVYSVSLQIANEEEISDEEKAAYINVIENSPPFVANIVDSLEILEDSFDNTINLIYTFSDVDIEYGDSLFFYIEGYEHCNVFIEENYQLLINPEANWNGQDTIVLIATDSFGESVSMEIIINVLPVNDPPELSFPISITFDEDETHSINPWDYILDVDNEVLYLQVEDSENINCELTDSLLTFIPEENWHGLEPLVFTVDDEVTRLSASDTVFVNVLSVNDPPQAVTDIEITADEGSEIVLDGSGSFDIDEDDFTFLWEVPEDWQIDDATAEIAEVILPYILDDTSVDVILTVTDAAGLTDEAVLIVNINDIVDMQPDTLPAVTSLTGIYPNPFNPETNISFELAADGFVLIEVYNIKGQKIATVLKQEMIAGAHTVIWNAKGQNSGIYFLRFETDGKYDLKKIILLK